MMKQIEELHSQKCALQPGNQSCIGANATPRKR